MDRTATLTLLALTALLLAWMIYRVGKPIFGRGKQSGFGQVPGGTEQPGTVFPPSRMRFQTVVTGLRLPVQFEYNKSYVKVPRRALIVSACGYVRQNGCFEITVVRCICGRAGVWRSFRLDRMDNFADLETGEIIADPKTWIVQKMGGLI